MTNTISTSAEAMTDTPKWVDRPLDIDEMRIVNFTYGEGKFTGSISSERTFPDGTKAYKVEYPQAYIDKHAGSDLPAYVHESALTDPHLSDKNGLNEHLLELAEASIAAEKAKPEVAPYDPDDISHTRLRVGGEFKDQRAMVEEARLEALSIAGGSESPSNYDYLLDPNYDGGSVEAARVENVIDEGERLARERAKDDNLANVVNNIDLKRRGY